MAKNITENINKYFADNFPFTVDRLTSVVTVGSLIIAQNVRKVKFPQNIFPTYKYNSAK